MCQKAPEENARSQALCNDHRISICFNDLRRGTLAGLACSPQGKLGLSPISLTLFR
jgi:hypothetical protein